MDKNENKAGSYGSFCFVSQGVSEYSRPRQAIDSWDTLLNGNAPFILRQINFARRSCQ